ncbi:MAG: PilZ domain-containing protein [Kiritimatiellia bacterium]|nr:PilZ domain-containing protein [Kiritimatiellia bacterium]MDP6847780.1 PilZ domain-containing protein [Kiritimatiellia bacterium]
MDERRQHPRMSDQNSVAVTILAAPASPELEGETFFCMTHNISVGGLMIHLSTRVPQGARMEMRIAFAEPIRAFLLVGRCAWTGEKERNGFPIGVEFVDGNEGDLDSWHSIVEQKLLYRGISTDDED